MKLPDKNYFLKSSKQTLEELYNKFAELPALPLQELDANKTVLMIVDMVNGFTNEGALQSSEIKNMTPEIVDLLKTCYKSGIASLAFADCHTNTSPEFDSYPAHCMVGTSESEIVDEIKEIGGYTLFAKNSTNGFLEEKFQSWLNEHSFINTFIVTGNCTDICIEQFAVTLKTWYNQNNQNVRIIVPINAVETYNLGLHNADLMNVMALFNMISNGIEIISEIKF